MKGILLAGGTGSRLYPNTTAINKHLLPVYDKPMIYYPLSIFMLGGIKEVLIICNKEDLPLYQKLLKDGSHLGLDIQYKIQERANGIAEAFILGADFINGENVCLLLGDNIFHSQNIGADIQECINLKDGAFVFAYPVADPKRYGVIDFDNNGHALSIEEKPEYPKTNFAVPGIYFYDSKVCEIAQSIVPSDRGELEITDVNNYYLNNGTLKVKEFGRGSVWFDTGTTQSLYAASEYIEIIEDRQGFKVACLEEIAINRGYVEKDDMKNTVETYPNSEYKEYLKSLLLN